LTADEVLSGKIGDGYVTAAKEIKGYELKSRPSNAVGFFGKDSKSVIYVYSKVNTDAQEDVPEIATNGKNNHQHQKTRQPKITETSYHKVNKKVNKFEDNTPKSNEATTQQLPKTGKNKLAQLLTTALGLISATSAAALAWIKRKKD
ncbi:MucBP domain-containing protein, partial [Lactobacillus apis]